MTSSIQTIPQQIVAQIRREILSGDRKEGEALREQDLSSRFGVSRGPVRAALLELSREGLVVTVPNRGVRIARHPSAAVHRLIVEMRQQIETFVVENAFRELLDTGLDKLEELLDQIREASEAKDLEQLRELEWAFHATVVGMLGDKHLEEIWHSVTMRTLLGHERKESVMESRREHERIVSAIRAGDLHSTIEELRRSIN